MTYPFLDTDIIIRLVTGDDPAKQAAARALFERVEQGHETVQAPITVIADAVYVLSSPRLYHLSRSALAAALAHLVRLPHLHIRQRRTVLRAIEALRQHQSGLRRRLHPRLDGAGPLHYSLLLQSGLRPHEWHYPE